MSIGTIPEVWRGPRGGIRTVTQRDGVHVWYVPWLHHADTPERNRKASAEEWARWAASAQRLMVVPCETCEFDPGWEECGSVSCSWDETWQQLAEEAP